LCDRNPPRLPFLQSRRTKSGHLSEEQAREWYMKIGAWQLWLELNQDDGH